MPLGACQVLADSVHGSLQDRTDVGSSLLSHWFQGEPGPLEAQRLLQSLVITLCKGSAPHPRQKGWVRVGQQSHTVEGNAGKGRERQWPGAG